MLDNNGLMDQFIWWAILLFYTVVAFTLVGIGIWFFQNYGGVAGLTYFLIGGLLLGSRFHE